MGVPARVPTNQPDVPGRPQLASNREKQTRLPRWFRFALIALVALVALAAVGLGLVAPRWPYSQKNLIAALQDAFKADAKVQSFRLLFFPHPGCEMEYLTLTRPERTPGGAPLASVQKMTITGLYTDFIFRPHHLADVRLNGLHVHIPPRSEREPYKHSSENSQLSKVTMGSVTANGAVLEIGREDHQEALKFEIHALRLDSIAAGEPMSYQLSMANPEPPGEVESKGSFGPWQPGQIGRIPLHGSAWLQDAKLDKYPGIEGTLHSEQRFSGTLEQIYVAGGATVENFRLKTAQHPVQIWSQFQLTVNALAGEVELKNVTARIGHSSAHIQGSIARNPKTTHEETVVDFAFQHGRAEDLLWFFNSEPEAAMRGPANLSGQVRVPKFGPGFLESLELKGRFEISNGHFQKSTQEKINELSARARGKKVNSPTDAPEVPIEFLSSEVTMQKGVAHFSSLDFQVPGAAARMHGTYSFLKHDVDLHGNLLTQAAISKDTTGIKAVLLKPLDPLFRKKHAGAQIPVVVDGPIKGPHFGMDLVKK